VKRLLRWTGFALRIPVALSILLFNLNLWTASSDTGTSAGLLDSLTEDLRRGAGDDMQALFPEGFVITHALVGFAWVDVALRVARADPLHDRALTKARWVLSRIDTDKGRVIFPASISPAYGAFYRGYRA